MAVADEPDRRRREERGQDETAGRRRRDLRPAAPIARVLPMTARVPLRERPDRTVLATIPFIALPVVEWSRAISGATLADLIGLVQHRGGRWLSQHTTTSVARSVPAQQSVDGDDGAHRVRLDVRFDGSWTGRFAVSAPVDEVATHLDALARSPILAFLPDEIADRALPPLADKEPLTWLGLSRLLDAFVYVTDMSGSGPVTPT